MKRLKRLGLLFMFAFVTLLALPLVAFAAEAAVAVEAPFVWWKFLTAVFTYLVLPVLGTVLTILATAAAHKLLKKFGLEANKATDDLVSAAAVKATAFAEEWAAKQLKAGNKPQSAAKLTQAVTKAREFLEGTGLDKIAEAKLVSYLEAHLNITRPMTVTALADSDPSQ